MKRKGKVYLPRRMPLVIGGFLLIIWLFMTSQAFLVAPEERMGMRDWLISSGFLLLPVILITAMSLRRIPLYEIEIEMDDEKDKGSSR